MGAIYAIRAFFGRFWEAIKEFFKPKKPHFSFITAHYVWIVGMTIIGSIAIYGSGHGALPYIDALMFASGANTQAGLNPVDTNNLNTFQQVVIYLIVIASNPITLHGSVVVLRLYWFEKRFQSVVREAKSRRRTLTKSKSKARDEAGHSAQGVNGRNITVVPAEGRSKKITNDGIVLDREQDQGPVPATKIVPSSDESDNTTTNASDDPTHGVETEGTTPRQGEREGEQPTGEHNDGMNGERSDSGEAPHANDGQHRSELPPGELKAETIDRTHSTGPTGITFAETVKRSDGVNDDWTNFSQRRPNSEHIAILERQRNQDTEVLRIPGPRDTERGAGPRRLDEHDTQEEDDGGGAVERTQMDETHPRGVSSESQQIRGRQPTITIAEPERRRRDEMAEDAEAWGHTFEALRLRKPRIFNSKQKRIHENEEEKRRNRSKSFGTLRSVLSRERDDDMPYLSYTPTIARNSNFVGLSLEQREELGGIEYRSLRTLMLMLFIYFWGFQLIILSCLLPYILENQHYGRIVSDFSINRTWWGFFTSNSAFNDVGFTLTPDSMNSFNTSSFVLMIMWFFMIIGNTGFPVMLRFCIWVTSILVPRGTGIWEELRFLLDHPRRCFTLLFPSGANWWLFWILIGLNAIDLFFFIVLDLGSGPIGSLPAHVRVVDGLFQAAATRTAGFSCVNLRELHPGILVLYIIMMYISVFPIAISIRRTNVYEEDSLGVYNEKIEDQADAGENDTPALSYVGAHLRRQLSFDLWFVFLGYFILSISEGSKIQKGSFSMFDILFEIVSAYGTVGLSMGATNSNASLSSQFSVVGKLVIVAMEIRGRHRGLPYGLDRAVLLPSESRFKKETEGVSATLTRSNTTTQTGAVTSGAQLRGSSVSRGRRRSISRERERGNSNLLTQFLHPGPAVAYSTLHSPRRSQTTLAAPSESLAAKRTRSEPLEHDEHEDFEDLAPLPTLSYRTTASRRTEQFPPV